MLNHRIDEKIVTVHELTFGRGRLTVGPEERIAQLIGLVVYWLFIVCVYSVSWLAKDFVNAAGRQRSEVGVPIRIAPTQSSALSYPRTAHR